MPDIVVGSPMQGIGQEMNFHEVAGVRLKNSKQILSKEARLSIVVFVVVAMPLRYLTCWFLSRSSEYDAKQYPPILDMATLEFSPALVALQFFSALLAGALNKTRPGTMCVSAT